MWDIQLYRFSFIFILDIITLSFNFINSHKNFEVIEEFEFNLKNDIKLIIIKMLYSIFSASKACFQYKHL